MELIIIDSLALSSTEMLDLEKWNKEHNPVTVVVVESDGNSKRFKLYETTAESFIDEIPSKYIIKR